jgi:uncharacterized protein, YigZ family
MDYRTIKLEAKAEHEEKKSTFIGWIKRVETEEAAKEFILKVKAAHREARHNVYAYVIGSNRGIQRYSDDGEPQGTAGIPVLEVLKKNDITDVVIVVTRYFGGILLGSAGLCRAYGKAASEAVKNAGIIERVTGQELSFTIDYDLLGKVQYIFTQNNWHIDNIEYSDKVKISIICETTNIALVESALREVSNNKFDLRKKEIDYYFKEGYILFKSFEA